LDQCVGVKRTPAAFQNKARGCEATLGKRCIPLQIPTLKVPPALTGKAEYTKGSIAGRGKHLVLNDL
jgi:hypothetical protein